MVTLLADPSRSTCDIPKASTGPALNTYSTGNEMMITMATFRYRVPRIFLNREKITQPCNNRKGFTSLLRQLEGRHSIRISLGPDLRQKFLTRFVAVPCPVEVAWEAVL
jgi:hypothetical protein